MRPGEASARSPVAGVAPAAVPSQPDAGSDAPPAALPLDVRPELRAAIAEDRPAVWPAPIALGVAGTVGLVSALVGDGAWDLLSWAALGLPVAVSARYGLPRRRRPPD